MTANIIDASVSRKNLPYHERLIITGLQSLEHRRLIIDLILCYNILNNYSCLDFNDFFSYNSSHVTLRHQFKLSIPRFKCNRRTFFFSCRIVPIWNSLPAGAVSAPSTKSFKFAISKIDFSKFLTFPTIF